MAQKIRAVITGDIINSTKLPKSIREKLYPKLNLFIKSLETKSKVKGEVNHGDWFRILVSDPPAALRLALKIKCFLKNFPQKDTAPKGSKKTGDKSFKSIDARIGIGTGKIDFINKRLGTSDGEAFQISGRLLEKIKSSHQSLAAQTSDTAINEELQTLLVLLDAIFAKTTPQQCLVIQRKLDGIKETDIAKELKIIQSSVNQRSSAGNWHAIEAAVNRYETLMKQV